MRGLRWGMMVGVCGITWSILGGAQSDGLPGELKVDAAMQGMPIYAEGGGYRYLEDSILDETGALHTMCGVFPRPGKVVGADTCHGYVELRLQRRSDFGMLRNDIVRF